MKININGNINEYYIQTLSMLFFPGVKFSESAEDTLQADVTITETEDGVCSTVTLKNGDAITTHTHTESRKNGTEKVIRKDCAEKIFRWRPELWQWQMYLMH